MVLQTVIEDAIAKVIDLKEPNQMAYSLMFTIMDAVVGEDKWKTEKRPKKSGPGLAT
jgi:hypothetical protein